ncbi:hypothetical protein [Qaidamihabitans albus]|uniref:hypothetical protein n=1 Tax=Qaidamihabitans albus TaxID=2795733 RepID=UPI0018F24DE6|nr:hypothetical protein [Qaidamihabitans albus]
MSTDATHVPLSRADRLRQDAEQAAEVRALSNHPDVIALRVEKVRTQVDAAVWAAILLGLAFTMVNVQTFAAAGAAVWSLPWLAAWLLDPMVSLALIAVLRAEQITARYQVAPVPWAARTKWFTFAATYTMNTWQSWAAWDAAGIVLHSVPPFAVLCLAETAPWLRDRLTEAVHAAATEAFTGTTHTTPATAPAEHPTNTAADTGEAPANKEAANTAATASVPARETRSARRTPASKPAQRGPVRRKLLADYVAEARAAWTPDVEISPAWVRSVTDCGRGTSKGVADALRAEHHLTEADQAAGEPVTASLPTPTTELAEAPTEVAEAEREAA